LHRHLAAAAEAAIGLAAQVPLQEGAYFTMHRRAIREALAVAGVTQRIDTLVAQLLDG
jgi:hypothetical protein